MTGIKKYRNGKVTSNRMDKTVVVQVERLVKHSKYKKYIRTRTRFKAHDEKNSCNVGDEVRIVETRPLSRDKRWAVVEVTRRVAE